MSQTRIFKVLRDSEKALKTRCQVTASAADPVTPECERACVIGGMTVIGDILRAYKVPDPTREMLGRKAKRLGIIVSPFEDCPDGFEEIFVKTPKNRKVKICRLGPDVRRKAAPEGRPYRPGAHKGALRRKRKYSRGLVTRPIREG